MLLSVLMLLIVSGTQGSHYLGTVVTYYTKETFTNRSVSVIVRFKYNFKTCDNGTFVCTGNCGDESLVGKKSEVQTNMWCQTEQITSRLLPNNSPFQLVYDSNAWVTNLYDLTSWRAVAEVELRSRSDTNKPNSSPQTTILLVLRFPSNCLRNINLVTFDPDGDKVKCRYADHRMKECYSPCTPPPVLSLSSNCTFSFNATSNKTEGLYAVQMVMEDFPRQQITLTQADRSQVVKTTSDAISRIPIQFGIQGKV
ncbi:uncharacterized protein LOC119792408 [Cyprinodon tularosa]|uniref:uncharacterized protein LOC119792408 n=1 Tax=Cyprinodon tularosa TaxID=77115 RepID=UPI0018E21F30|nr:uncharacterized protein LOC119792408 [Cyprinodon tularosa]